MPDFTLVGWVAMAFAAIAVAALAGWLVQLTARDQLVRCPETGGIGVVDVVPVTAERGKSLGLSVRQCDLWPERKGCSAECLVRRPDAAADYPVDLGALRLPDRP